MQVRDDRTPEQKETHNVLVVGTDRFMSGWGNARNGKSVAAWACKPDHESQVERWVRNRSDMTRVRIVDARGYRPSGRGDCHIYVVEDGHPALR